MPFIKQKFNIKEETIAFLYVMKTLNFTQGQAQRHIAKGRLIIDGESMFLTGKKIIGDVVMVFFQAKSRGLKPLFQNKDFMIFEKASGVLVHPNTMSTPYSILDEIRSVAGDNANATHRIDMETSGLILGSKHKDAERFIKNSFEIKTIKKHYLAWVDGKVEEPFSVSEPISINKEGYENTKHKVFINPMGKPSHTDFVPLEYDEDLDASLVACYPQTGRTHQIRIHLFHVKRPILGDPIYGASFEASDDYLNLTQSKEDRLLYHGASRLMLHAKSLSFTYNNQFHIESKLDFYKEKSLIYPKEKRLFNK
jgi:23S rRNA pseudouridine1911/1915/1917 synthase